MPKWFEAGNPTALVLKWFIWNSPGGNPTMLYISGNTQQYMDTCWCVLRKLAKLRYFLYLSARVWHFTTRYCICADADKRFVSVSAHTRANSEQFSEAISVLFSSFTGIYMALPCWPPNLIPGGNSPIQNIQSQQSMFHCNAMCGHCEHFEGFWKCKARGNKPQTTI